MLRFTPTAWAKLIYLRDAGPTEIGGFGRSSPADLLHIEDVCLVQQICTATHIEFDDASVADFFDEEVDAGRRPEFFGRIWIHTHPGNSAEPSRTDEETFERVFGDCEWSVMFILARGGQSLARLRCNVGPGADVKLSVEVDFCRPFNGSNEAAWQREFERCVREQAVAPQQSSAPANTQEIYDWYDLWDSHANQFQSNEELVYDYFDEF